jgi:LSD1 subclass zinc finger protein
MNSAQTTIKAFPCHQCGAKLSYAPGTTSLKCEYCGFLNEIPQSTEEIEELDFTQYLEIARTESVPDTEQTLKCSACAAEFTASGTAVTDSCPFCGSNVLVPAPAEVRIRPKSLLPFKLTIDNAREVYRKWISSRWLAPNALKRFAREEGKLLGIYVPYWTYDCNTTTAYTGQRGIHRYRTESYTDSDGNTQTREVRETDWYFCSGVVFDQFDDLLVPASSSVPEQHAKRLKDWDLPDLVPYQEAYLSGYRTERYRKGLEEGFEDAKHQMVSTIDRSICWDIGGDEQRILTKASQYDNITFKHVLLPIYLGAYRFRDRAYSYLVNARTGEIFGDAPISIWKVLGLVVLGLLIIGGILYLKSKGQR